MLLFTFNATILRQSNYKCRCYYVLTSMKKEVIHLTSFQMAEGGGFEPPNGFPLPVFKTGAFSQLDHLSNLSRAA